MYKREWPAFWSRFWSRVSRGANCWIWQGPPSTAGYGRIRPPDRPEEGTHRVAWRWAFGEIPDKAWVLHRCNVRRCVRPDHLYIGGPKENYADAREAGTNTQGERHWQRRKTHCSQGHEYSEANIYRYQGRRYCRACHRVYSLRYARRKLNVQNPRV